MAKGETNLEQMVAEIVQKNLETTRNRVGLDSLTLKAEKAVNAERNTCVYAEVDHLSKSLCELEENLKVLNEKLGPVLRSPPDIGLAIGIARSDKDAPLVNAITEQTVRVMMTTNTVRDLISRVQIL